MLPVLRRRWGGEPRQAQALAGATNSRRHHKPKAERGLMVAPTHGKHEQQRRVFQRVVSPALRPSSENLLELPAGARRRNSSKKFSRKMTWLRDIGGSSPPAGSTAKIRLPFGATEK